MDFTTSFYSKEFNAQSLSSFKEFLKQKGVVFKNKELVEWYSKQDLPQRMKQFVKQKKFNPIITLEPNNVLYMDTVFVDKYAIILAIDLFSKKAYAYAKKVSIARGEKIPVYSNSIKATDAAIFLQNILKTDVYKEIRTDDGSEFKASFSKLIRDRELTHMTFKDATKRLTSPVERLNRTFRNLYEKKKAIYDGAVFKNYKKFVDEIIDTYNNSKHRTVNDSPNEIYKNRDKQKKLIEIYRQKLYESRFENNHTPLEPGTKVRLFIPQKSAFNKLKPNWSKTVYTIEADTYNKKFNRYYLNDKMYAVDYLQVIPEQVEKFEIPRPVVVTSAKPSLEREPITRGKSTRVRRKRVVTDL